jgi:hypothetical protein
MDGKVVFAGIATCFFRKVNPNPQEGPQVYSYKLRRSAIDGLDEFVLEGSSSAQ